MLNLTKCKIALSNLNWTELYEYISGVYGLLAACAAMWQSERYISRVYCTVCALARVCRHVAVRAIYQPRVLYCMCSGPRMPPCGIQSDISAACIVYCTVCALGRLCPRVPPCGSQSERYISRWLYHYYYFLLSD